MYRAQDDGEQPNYGPPRRSQRPNQDALLAQLGEPMAQGAAGAARSFAPVPTKADVPTAAPVDPIPSPSSPSSPSPVPPNPDHQQAVHQLTSGLGGGSAPAPTPGTPESGAMQSMLSGVGTPGVPASSTSPKPEEAAAMQQMLSGIVPGAAQSGQAPTGAMQSLLSGVTDVAGGISTGAGAAPQKQGPDATTLKQLLSSVPTQGAAVSGSAPPDEGALLKQLLSGVGGGSVLSRLGTPGMAPAAMQALNGAASRARTMPESDARRKRLAEYFGRRFDQPFTGQAIERARKGYDIRQGGFGDALRFGLLDDPDVQKLLGGL